MAKRISNAGLVACIAATLLIREKPLIYSGERAEFEFWRRSRREPWGRS